MHYKVTQVVGFSTDKAAQFINTMGITKALIEKVVFNKSRDP